MRYLVLACDYDGTLAADGVVDDTTVAALDRVKESGRRLVLVTGRELDDLKRVFARTDLFDRIVAENGALVHNPATGETRLLGEPPPEAFVAALRERGVSPMSVGRVITATWKPNETVVLEVIRDLGLELQVIFNKGAVMVLPSGLNKATGLLEALHELSVSRHNTVGVGDAENDHAFLNCCECAVAVANALPSLKERVDYVTAAPRSAGVVELIDLLLAADLVELEPSLARHWVPVGVDVGGEALKLRPHGDVVLVAGPSGSGKSTFVTAFLERLAERAYQFCLIDPEGDYSNFEGAIVLGDAKSVPSIEEVATVFDQHNDSVIVVLLGLAMNERPAFFEQLLTRLLALRGTTARPHWILLDEAHHLMPARRSTPAAGYHPLGTALLITVHPDHVARSVLDDVDVVVALGRSPGDTLREFAEAAGIGIAADRAAAEGEALVWVRQGDPEVRKMRPDSPRMERLRHKRKYAEGSLGPDKSFYFRGPDNRLQLRAQNLAMFVQIAEGLDEETWRHHLERGDYSRWAREAIKDVDLADEIASVERARLAPAASRRAVADAINRRYTHPA
jgi:hydroxymethylpyrimidine pyrophosphatase-like HAD family hydrolase